MGYATCADASHTLRRATDGPLLESVGHSGRPWVCQKRPQPTPRFGRLIGVAQESNIVCSLITTLAKVGRVLALAGSAAAVGTASARAETPAPPAPPFVQTALSLTLSVDYERPSVDGTTAITLVNRGGRSETEVPILLNRLMSVRSVTDGDGRVLKYQSSVSIFEDDPFRQVLATHVTLAAPLRPGATVTLRVRHDGPLVGYTETGSLYIKDKIDPAFTILRTDALAFPEIGVASDRANRLMKRDDFRFDARVTVPAAQVVATGGTLVERTTAGATATYHFAGDRVPFVNIAIAPYKLIDAGVVRVYALPADAARAKPMMEATLRAIGRLVALYGPLPAKPQVTVIEIPDGFGSQASATAGIILDASAFGDQAQLTQLYHEVSHFWNPRDLDAPSPRWNEGLAMYLQYRLAREMDQFAETRAAIERARSRVCAADVRTQLERTPFARFGVEGTTDFSYRVGFLMFTALEALLGPERLDAAVREFVQGHIAKGGTTAELTATISRASTARPLDSFFRDWMETSAWVAPVCSAPSFADAIARWK